MQFTENMFADHMRGINGSAIRELMKLTVSPGMISFAGGNPSNAALEPEVVKEMTCEVLDKYGTAMLQYGPTDGFNPLRESAAEFLNTAGVKCTAETLLPTQGGTQAFDMLLKSIVNPGDVVLCESPTFLGALQAIREHNARPIAIPTDEHGVIVEAAEEMIKQYHPKMMYIIPTFQNPTGITLTLERRKALAELANKYGVVLAEDDPYRDLRYTGEALPAIQSFDEEGWVVYMSSFSKYIAPGLRLGAAVANPLLLRKMVISKQSCDTHSPTLNQAIVDAFLRKGLMPGHLERICNLYRVQMNTMLECFDMFPAGTTHTNPEGGLFVWAELPEGMDASAVFAKAVENKVAFVPGISFYPENGNKRALRLNYSMCEPPVIKEGMTRLANVIKEMM
ncbi:MAG: PLP-dependent aminotransferase family protein [Clostridia bacterium]|nr:PLP-dependent aminotransferase family protein [Clostridia bacterium]